jgi:hypothetical protein
VNSSGDDFCFVYNEQTNTGFVTSNRKGGKGCEDIYTVNMIVELQAAPVKTTVSTKTQQSVITKPSTSTMNSPNALPTKEALYTPTKRSLKNPSEQEDPANKTIQGIVQDAITSEPLAQVLITCMERADETGKTKITTKSDKDGLYNLKLAPKKDYIINYSKAGYENLSKSLKTQNIVVPTILGVSQMKPSATNLSSTDEPQNPTKASFAAKHTEPVAYDIIVATTSKPLPTAKAEELREVGVYTATKNPNGSYTHKLGTYETVGCAEAAKEKVEEIGFKNALIVKHKKSSADDFKLTMAAETGICPSEELPPAATPSKLRNITPPKPQSDKIATLKPISDKTTTTTTDRAFMFN